MPFQGVGTVNFDELMDAFEQGRLNRDEFKRGVLEQSFIDTGCAKLDHQRALRTGGPEVVYCESKTPTQVSTIFKRLFDCNGRVLGTRASLKHYEAVRADLEVEYFEESGLLVAGKIPENRVGKIVVVSAGTSDQPVAEEAAVTAEFLGSRVARHYDCGVAGIHRLFSVLDEFNDASVIIAVAGMEGALPSVVGGVALPPILAVPTSVGYGANFRGLSALLAMLNSCSPGVGVLNIDNGFGAGFLGHKINLLSVKK